MDDGSADNSFEIAEGFESENVFVIQKENSGSAATRNVGLRKATGDYIQYLDADDILHQDKIKQQVKLLENQPEGYLASCGWGKFTQKLQEASFSRQPVWGDFDPVGWLTTAWEGGGMMQTACWLTPREVAEKAGEWNEALLSNPADDGEYFCRVILQSRGIKFSDDAQVYYRDYPSQNRVSKQLSDNAVHSLYQNCVLYEQYILPHENSPRVRHALMMNYLNFIYRFYPNYPELIDQAKNKIKALGFKKLPIIGGKNFKRLASIIGFENALWLRSAFQK